jgi:hypothetical protein
MVVNHQNFYKKLIEDYFSFLKAPKSFLQKQLDNFNSDFVDKRLVAFVFLMHVYYFFSPAYLLGTNLMSLVIVFFSVGIFYFLSQICLQSYQERIGQESYDPQKLYVFAYAFALAELTGLILNTVVLFFNLTHVFSFIGWLLSFFLMLPVLIIVIVLKLSIFKVVNPDEFSLITFFKLFLEAIIETMKNNFGYSAWRELWADYNAENI